MRNVRPMIRLRYVLYLLYGFATAIAFLPLLDAITPYNLIHFAIHALVLALIVCWLPPSGK